MPELISKNGAIPGIKVDKGAKPLAGSKETVTEGLDGLRERLKEYYSWRKILNGEQYTKLATNTPPHNRLNQMLTL